MTWINSAELASIRTRERVANDDLAATRVALSKALGSVATGPTLLGFDPTAPYAEMVACDLAAAQVRVEKAEARIKVVEAERDTMRSQRDSARADLADVRKVLDTANGGQVAVLVGYSTGGVETKVAPRSATVTAAEHLASRVADLKAKVKAQREELDAVERQRAQEAVDAEYAALPECPAGGWLRCPKCSRDITSPRLSDDADQNPQSAEMYGVVMLHTLTGQGATATVEPARPKLPQHLVWRCGCGHVEKTKTRDAS